MEDRREMRSRGRRKQVSGGRREVVLETEGLEMGEEFLGSRGEKVTELIASSDPLEVAFTLDDVRLSSVSETRGVVAISKLVDPPAVDTVDGLLDRDLTELLEVLDHDAVCNSQKIRNVVGLNHSRISSVQVLESTDNR